MPLSITQMTQLYLDINNYYLRSANRQNLVDTTDLDTQEYMLPPGWEWKTENGVVVLDLIPNYSFACLQAYGGGAPGYVSANISEAQFTQLENYAREVLQTWRTDAINRGTIPHMTSTGGRRKSRRGRRRPVSRRGRHGKSRRYK